MHLHIVVCAGIVPDPLQTLEPVSGPNGPGLKNEMVLPAVLDPWAASALYEAADLAANFPAARTVSKVWLVSLGPKAKLQQVMMTVAQKAALNWFPSTAPSADFPMRTPPQPCSPRPSPPCPVWTAERLLLFGGWESATRGAGVTLQLVGERLGITDQFQGVDQIDLRDDGSFEVLERVEGGKHQVSVCAGTPAVLGWATGNLAEPRNNPQVGMANMRDYHARAAKGQAGKARGQRPALSPLSLPKQQRTTRVVKDLAPDEIADELVAWMRSRVRPMESILVLTHVDETGAALSKASLEAVTAGVESGHSDSVPRSRIGIVGRDATDVVGANGCRPQTGARLLAVSGEAFAQAALFAATQPPAKRSAAPRKPASFSLRGSRFARVAAGVAHRLGGFIDTHITAIGGTETVEATAGSIASASRRSSAATRAPGSCCSIPGTHAALCRLRPDQPRQLRRSLSNCPRCAPPSAAFAPRRRGANHPPRRKTALRRRRRLDQETARRTDPCRRGRRADSRFPARVRAHRWAAANRWSIRAAKASRCFPSSRI